MRDFAIAATVCLAATFPFAAPAHAFTAQNGLVVEPDANGFAVPWRGMAGPADFWCAAGDYAIRGGLSCPASQARFWRTRALYP